MQHRTNVGSGRAGDGLPEIDTGAALPAEERDRRLYNAVLAFQAGRYHEAETEARRLGTVPGYFPAVLLLGMVAGRTGRAVEGIELLRAAVALDRRSIEARNELASLLRSEGRNDEAIAEAKHAVRLKPDDAGSHNNLGLCYLAAGSVPQAIRHFRRAIALKPDAAFFHHNLGLSLEQQSRGLEAITAFRRTLAVDPQHADAHAHLGRLLLQHGEPEEAALCYERAAALQPDPTIAAVQKAEILIQQGRAAEAEQVLRSAITADPKSDLVYQVLGVLLQRLGRFDEAIDSLKRATELQPRRVSAWSSMVLGKKIGPDDAWIIEAMLNLADDDSLSAHDRSRLHFALGKAHDDLSEYESAIKHFDQAHKIEAVLMRQSGRSFDRRAHRAFIDQTIAGFTSDFFAHPSGGSSDTELPILIVGMPRSGTTLVEQILSNHPEIGAAGELSYWMDRQFLAGAAVKGTLGEAQSRGLAANYLALLRTAAPLARRVTDKMPANFLVLGLIQRVLPRARIVHCRRNAVDTCLSIYATPFGNPLDFAHDRGDLVFYYEQYARLMAHWRRVIPADRLLEIDYESLVAEPERVTRALIGFCGLEWNDACLHHERNAHVIMTPSLWQARQPVYRAAVERRRRYDPWLGAFRQLLTVMPG